MKFLQLALLLVGLITTTGMFAATTTTTSAQRAKARAAEYAKKHKKNVIKKQTPAKKETPKKAAALDRAALAKKGKWQKMETKKHTHKPGSRKPVVKSSAQDRPAVATTAPSKPAETTITDKVIDWLGWGAAGTAATKAYTQHKTAGYHIGPRNWHHNFGAGWGDRGWVEGTNEHGHWVFAGYRPDWWRDQPEYSSYYHNVILPLYRKTAEYQQLPKK